MPIESLRAFLEQVEAQGDLLRIDGADREEEIGALADIIASTSKHHLVLFDKMLQGLSSMHAVPTVGSRNFRPPMS